MSRIYVTLCPKQMRQLLEEGSKCMATRWNNERHTHTGWISTVNMMLMLLSCFCSITVNLICIPMDKDKVMGISLLATETA